MNAEKSFDRCQHRCRGERIAAESKKIARRFDAVVSENIFADSDKLQRKRIARHGWGMRFVFYSARRFVQKRDSIDFAVGKKRQLRKAENTLRQCINRQSSLQRRPKLLFGQFTIGPRTKGSEGHRVCVVL